MWGEEREKADGRSSLVQCEVRVICSDLTKIIFYGEGENQETVGTGRCRYCRIIILRRGKRDGTCKVVFGVMWSEIFLTIIMVMWNVSRKEWCNKRWGGVRGGCRQVSFPFDWAPASEEAKCETLGKCPLFLPVAPYSVEWGGPSFNWLCQTQQKSC
jgi:hypothetical protein